MAQARQWRWVVIAAGAAVLLFIVAPAALRWLTAPRDEEAPPSRSDTFHLTQAQLSDLRFAPVRAVDLPDVIEAEGKIGLDSDRIAALVSPVTGQVTRVFVSVGSRVAKGDPLVAIKALEAIQAQSDLATTAGALEAARMQLAQAEAAEHRQEALLRVEGAAQRDLDQARTDLAMARSAEKTAAAAQAAARDRLASYGVRRIDLAKLTAGHGEVILRAAAEGAVISRQVNPGMTVSGAANGSGTPLITIGDTSSLWLVGYVSATDAPRVRVGEAITATTSGGASASGVIDSVAPALDPATQRLVVRARISSGVAGVTPEMFARVRINVGQAARVLAVPEAAVVREGDTARVWVRHGQAELALRPITLGRARDGWVEVRSGLAQDDQVVTSGAVFIDRAATAQ
jgi:membrane fusion protein, heavy metal efflux system